LLYRLTLRLRLDLFSVNAKAARWLNLAAFVVADGLADFERTFVNRSNYEFHKG